MHPVCFFPITPGAWGRERRRCCLLGVSEASSLSTQHLHREYGRGSSPVELAEAADTSSGDCGQDCRELGSVRQGAGRVLQVLLPVYVQELHLCTGRAETTGGKVGCWVGVVWAGSVASRTYRTYWWKGIYHRMVVKVEWAGFAATRIHFSVPVHFWIIEKIIEACLAELKSYSGNCVRAN